MYIMASQKHYESLDDGSEFSVPCSLPPCTQPQFDGSSSDSDMELSEDNNCAAAAAAPQSETEKRVFRAAAFLKRAQQEAAASEHCVFGAKAAALELVRMHEKKVAAVVNATKRLKTAKSMRGGGVAAGGVFVAAVAAPTEKLFEERSSPKANAKPKASVAAAPTSLATKKKKHA